MEHSQEFNISYHFKCVSQTHGQRQDWPQQPDETDHHLGGALALLLGQRMNNGVIPVNTDGNKCPHRGVHLTNIIVRASCLQRNSYCFAGNCTFAFFSHYRTTFNIWSYWESLHEGTELTHELWKIPSLHQRCSELEWNTKHREDHIRQSQVGDVEVRHRLHSPGG